MSEAIVVRSSNEAMQLGGIGVGAKMFRARPSMIELVHKSSTPSLQRNSRQISKRAMTQTQSSERG